MWNKNDHPRKSIFCLAKVYLCEMKWMNIFVLPFSFLHWWTSCPLSLLDLKNSFPVAWGTIVLSPYNQYFQNRVARWNGNYCKHWYSKAILYLLFRIMNKSILWAHTLLLRTFYQEPLVMTSLKITESNFCVDTKTYPTSDCFEIIKWGKKWIKINLTRPFRP